MPPKKADASKKTIEKQKQKVIEDKTFGLKNKKGAKQQKFISQVQKQVTHGNKSARELELMEQKKLESKLEKKKKLDQFNELFKPVADLQKCAQGVDPKSVLCVYFKQGQCMKGNKCKFSHDLAIERKSEKRSAYDDGTAETDDMTNWDMEKLEDVVAKKHGTGQPSTSIVCKYFIDALENSKYGWFWECPNGPTCHYRHALPPGFILKKDQKKMEEQKEVISLEELIETERQNLGLTQTKVTFKSFLEWKKRKKEKEAESRRSAKASRENEFKQGRMVGISGREMFEFDPSLVAESADAVEDGDVYAGDREEMEDEYTGPMREIDCNTFLLSEADNPTDETPDRKSEPSQNGLPQKSNGDQLEVDEELFNQSDLEDLENEIAELEVEE